MGDLGEQDGYPVGVSNADFIADEDAPCFCGHAADEHDADGCGVDECDCVAYEADEEAVTGI